MEEHEFTMFINKHVSDLWKVALPTSEGDSVSGPLTPEELANILNYLEQGKSP